MNERRRLVGVAIAASLAIAAPRAEAQPAAAAPASTTAVGPVPGIGDAPQPVNPLAGDAAARATGRRLFVAYNCAGCHGDHGGGGMGPSLRDPVWIYGGTDADVFDSIAQGRANGMPAWGTLLPAAQIWPIATYIKSDLDVI